jgi:hypothetical protein
MLPTLSFNDPAKRTISEEIKLLLDQKGNTCISIVLPLHNLTIDQ